MAPTHGHSGRRRATRFRHPIPGYDGAEATKKARYGTRTDTRTRFLAEKAFKAATTKPAELPPKQPTMPNVKEQVTLRIDRDVLDHFQEGGPGWQDRINAALRKAAGK